MRLALPCKTNAEMITPIKTANAKLCNKIVIMATKTPTNISCLGILFIILNHSNVPIATIIITTKAAIGRAQ
jgi:hypothetical protein